MMLCNSPPIRVTVSENQVLELVWRMAKPSDRTEDGCLLIRARPWVGSLGGQGATTLQGSAAIWF